jgi:uncharacterized membrane protein YqiK
MLPQIIFAAILAIGLLVLLVIAAGIRFIPNNRIGIVVKRFASRSVSGGFIALQGEAGYQPDVLRGGLHYLMPFQFNVHIAPLVTSPQGKIGYIFARDGPPRQILREGTYAINLAQFVVITEEKVYDLPLGRDDQTVIQNMAAVIGERNGFTPAVIKDSDDLVGIVTGHDGPSLPAGEIIAPVVGDDRNNPETYHNNFQMPDRFLKANGLRGRQLQVLVEGTYYLNRLFATVQMIPKTVVEVGTVGVVVSYTGAETEDLSGMEYRHGELVKRDSRGVWSEPLLPGKYACNTYAGKVLMVPTTNSILKWIRSEVGSHRFDENLSEVLLITKDAFEPSLPLSVVIHIDYQKAPLVIQRFGDVKRLVEQTLDPMVSAYFKNIGQTRMLIQLIQERNEIQRISGQEMKDKFAHYNLEVEEVLIGTPTTSGEDKQIESILNQLRSRQIAVEQIETYARQETAAKERELREAQSRAEQQRNITESELSITVQSNQGKAEYQRALQKAAQIRTLAEAERIARTGIAQAIATEEQVAAYGGLQYQVTQQVLTRFAEAIQEARVDVVPRVSVTSRGEGGAAGSNIMEGLLTMLLSERMGVPAAEASARPRSPEAERLRDEIRQKRTESKEDQGPAAPK